MEPTFIQEVTDPDGRTSEELDPEEFSEVMSEDTAAQVADMMTNVAEEGTASSLSVAGSTLAGKTGTAEIDVETSLNQAQFIGFAPADDPADRGRRDRRALHRLLRRRHRRPDRDRRDGARCSSR